MDFYSVHTYNRASVNKRRKKNKSFRLETRDFRVQSKYSSQIASYVEKTVRNYMEKVLKFLITSRNWDRFRISLQLQYS